MYHTSFYEMRADRPYYFNIFHYMITKDSPKADDEVHYHQSLEFVYVADGVFPIHVQGETHILQKNELAYIPSGQVHYYTTLSDANVFVFIVSVDYLNDPIYGSQCLIPNIMKLSPGCAAKLESILYCL